MALFLDTKIPPPAWTGNRIYNDIKWHSSFPLLAIAIFDDKKGGIVSIYDQKKEETADVDSTPHPNVQVISISWHPSQQVLAIGYESGEVIVWNNEEGESFEGFKTHQSSIVLMEWSNCGGIFVTADNMGGLVVWKSDSQGHLQAKSHHDLKDPVCQIAFRRNFLQNYNKSKIGEEFNERTLGEVTTWRPKTARKNQKHSKSSATEGMKATNRAAETSFYIGLLGGAINYVTENGSCNEVLTSGSSVKCLLYHQTQDILIVMTEAFILGQFKVDHQGNLQEIHKTKMHGSGDVQLSWIGIGTVAVLSNELSIRIWEIDSGENYLLEPKGASYLDDEVFVFVNFNENSGILCASTNKGKLAMWKEKLNDENSEELKQEERWEWYNITMISGNVKSAIWCPNVSKILACNTYRDIYILTEQELSSFYGQKVGALQTMPDEVSVAMYDFNLSFNVKCDFQFKEIFGTQNHICLWNNSKIVTFEIGPSISGNHRLIGNFSCKCTSLCVNEQSLFTLETDPDQIQIRTFQGTIKQTLATISVEGPPITLFTGSEYLTAGTSAGFIKIWNIGRREAKLHIPVLNIASFFSNFGEIVMAKCNENCTKLAFTIAKANLIPSSSFYIWDINLERLSMITFPGRFVSSYFWDCENPNYIALQIKNFMGPNLRDDHEDEKLERFFSAATKTSSIRVSSSATTASESSTGSFRSNPHKKIDEKLDEKIMTIFSCTENGILVHEEKVKKNSNENKILLGLDVPYVVVRSKRDIGLVNKNGEGRMAEDALKFAIDREILKDFNGMEEADKETRNSLLSYVYFTIFGDIDSALQAMRNMNNKQIWENMAKICVKTKRADVALVSMARLNKCREAIYIKRAIDTEPEKETHVAMLAIQLNMMNEAIELYKECGRFDLLLDLYEKLEMWKEAIDLCKNYLRINLRSTYYKYAKYLEREKCIVEAIEMYEKSETFRYEVPRMLQDFPKELETYILEKKDSELYQWYAQYLESQQDPETALTYYSLAEDWLSHNRLLCYQGQMDKAVEKAQQVNDKAASYHIAAILEQKGDFERAIDFFKKANAYGNAMRICKEVNLLDQLWTLALMAQPEDQASTARFFESKQEDDMTRQAIQLYHLAGYASKALDLAFASQQYSTLQTIVKDFLGQNGKNIDSKLLEKTAAYFIAQNEYERALDMLAAAEKYSEAMELCVEFNINISEEIAERLTVPKSKYPDENTRISLLEKMGESCMLQGNYLLAAKKFTQAGQKVKAMKALVKSGEKDKVIYYANVSRDREVFIIAGNFLQTTDWRNNLEVIKKIENFYKKAKAPQHLAQFYSAAAAAEIEEEKNYEKALKEYGKSMAILKEINENSESHEINQQLNAVQRRINNIQKFIRIKESLNIDPDNAQSQLRKLLEEPDIDESISRGDAYALLVEYYASIQNYTIAVKIIEEMRAFIPNGQNMTNFIKSETLQAIDKALNISILSMFRGNSGKSRYKSKVNLIEERQSSNGNAKEDEEEEEEEELLDEEEELDDEESSSSEEDDDDEEDENTQVEIKTPYISQPTYRVK